MFDQFLESSRWDDSKKLLKIGFGEEMGIIEIQICILSGALQPVYSMLIIMAPDKVRIFIMPISLPNHVFDHLLESSRWDDSYKWSNIGFGEEMGIIELKIRTLSGALIPVLNNHMKKNGLVPVDMS